MWTDGKEISFTNWNSGEPNNATESKCVATEATAGKWVNVPCEGSKNSICEKGTSHKTIRNKIIHSELIAKYLILFPD